MQIYASGGKTKLSLQASFIMWTVEKFFLKKINMQVDKKWKDSLASKNVPYFGCNGCTTYAFTRML